MPILNESFNEVYFTHRYKGQIKQTKNYKVEKPREKVVVIYPLILTINYSLFGLKNVSQTVIIQRQKQGALNRVHVGAVRSRHLT